MGNGKWEMGALMTLVPPSDDVAMTPIYIIRRMTTPLPLVPSWDLKDLVAWQVALDFATSVYQATRRFPDDERFGLRMQVRRSVVSVASNIAEGHGRSNRREYARFVLIARGSLKEAETQLLLCERLGYLSQTKAQELLALSARINRLLTGLRRRLKE
jgi:four helix bundle protein